MLAKKYELLPTKTVFSPDEVFDKYVEFSEDLYIDANTYHILIRKANSFIHRPWYQTNLVLSLIEKVKSGFLISLMYMFPESNRTKLWSHRFHLQNSGTLQTRMDQRALSMKINFDIFQIQKWISQTVGAQKVNEKNEAICLVSFFSSWVIVLILPIFLQICADV